MITKQNRNCIVRIVAVDVFCKLKINVNDSDSRVVGVAILDGWDSEEATNVWICKACRKYCLFDVWLIESIPSALNSLYLPQIYRRRG